jgi:hypothetical protein
VRHRYKPLCSEGCFIYSGESPELHVYTWVIGKSNSLIAKEKKNEIEILMNRRGENLKMVTNQSWKLQLHAFSFFSFGFFCAWGGRIFFYSCFFPLCSQSVHSRFLICSLRCLQLRFIFCPILFGYGLTSMYINCEGTGAKWSLTKQTTILQRGKHISVGECPMFQKCWWWPNQIASFKTKQGKTNCGCTPSLTNKKLE